LFVFLGFSLSSFALAESFISLVDSTKNTIYTDEIAEFTLYITNTQEVDDTINMRFDDLYWDLQSMPLYHYFSGINIKAGETISTSIYFSPTQAIGIGRYNLGLDLISKNTGQRITKSLTISVIPKFQKNVDYNPAIDVTAIVPETIDPREDFDIKINLKNKNALDIKNLTISIDGFLISDYRETSLQPLYEKTEEFKFKLENLQNPIEDKITITVKRGEDIIRVVKASYKVSSYSKMQKDYNEVNKFFLTEKTIKVTNIGNIRNAEKVRVATGPMKRLFERSTPPSKYVKDIDGTFDEWEVKLNPYDTTLIKVQTNYRSLIVIFILIVLGVAGYYLFRNEIVIKKVGSIISTREGGASEVKILIYVKNRGNNFVQSINVIDRIPTLVDISAEHTIGTLSPTKILKHDKKGTLMKWEIETLESQEERILSYKIITRLSILGQFNLPTAIVKYKTNTGSEKLVGSNVPKV
jgi:hypothetical protein